MKPTIEMDKLAHRSGWWVWFNLWFTSQHSSSVSDYLIRTLSHQQTSLTSQHLHQPYIIPLPFTSIIHTCPLHHYCAIHNCSMAIVFITYPYISQIRLLLFTGCYSSQLYRSCDSWHMHNTFVRGNSREKRVRLLRNGTYCTLFVWLDVIWSKLNHLWYRADSLIVPVSKPHPPQVWFYFNKKKFTLLAYISTVLTSRMLTTNHPSPGHGMHLT